MALRWRLLPKRERKPPIARRALPAACKVLSVAAAVLAAGLWQAAAAPPPQRIVSMNLCTDQLVLALAGRDRIQSLSFVVSEPEHSTAHEAARGIHLNHGRSEPIVRMEPDIVVAGPYSPKATMLLLERLGYDVAIFQIARSLADVRDRIRQMGAVLGEWRGAASMVRAFDARLAALRPADGGPRPTALYLQPNGYTSGRGTLVGDVIAQAGLENLGDRFGIDGHGRVSFENLLAADPDVLITQDLTAPAPALAYEFLEHPALKALMGRALRVVVPTRYWICGIPATLRALEILADARRKILAERRP